jgi:hypothetical protein
MRSPQEEAAHRYADHGWYVFPTAPGGKIPATEHGFLDATTHHKQIQQWWRAEPRANVAIATGAPGPDVVDVDKHGDRSGYAAWNSLRYAGLAGEPQAVIRTPSGGMHAYYKGTQQRNGSLPGHAIDFRSTGGYVVTAPSKDAGGRSYAVVTKQPSAATFNWSAAREHLDPQRERQPQRSPQRPAGGPRDVSHLAAWVASQREGNRNQGLFWAANRAVEAGDIATLDKLAHAARQAGLDDHEIDRTIRSAQTTTAGLPFEAARSDARPAARAGREQLSADHTEPRQQEREPATVPATVSPRADVERATAAGTAAARASKQPEHELEPGA